MIRTEIKSARATIRVHDEFICANVEAVMPQLDQIVSEAYQRRLSEPRKFPVL